MGDATFARYFDAQYRAFGEDLPLWLHLALEQGDPIIELGCGTGRVVRSLIQAGHRVIGIDHDHHMLTRAQKNLAPFFLKNACFVQADMQTFGFNMRYNAAISPMNTLCIFDDHGLIKVFHNIARQLSPTGLFAFEILNPSVDPFEGIDPEEPLISFIEPESGNPCQVYAQRIGGPAQDQVGILWHYDELLPDGSTQRYPYRQNYYLRSKEKVREFLKRANCTVIEVYGDYARSHFEENSETMVVVARANPP
jgi:SAM-dependent methyltransferase